MHQYCVVFRKSVDEKCTAFDNEQNEKREKEDYGLYLFFLLSFSFHV